MEKEYVRDETVVEEEHAYSDNARDDATSDPESVLQEAAAAEVPLPHPPTRSPLGVRLDVKRRRVWLWPAWNMLTGRTLAFEIRTGNGSPKGHLDGSEILLGHLVSAV